MELFNPNYVTGNLQTTFFGVDLVGMFVRFFGPLCAVIISIVGFGIVNASIFKNALNGLYYTFPRLFDKVDELRSTAASMQQKGGIEKYLGLGLSLVLKVIPNVKAMSDFQDEVPDPKLFFMKAIPLALVQIFVGVFIYYGYTAALGEKVSKFGTELIDVVLLNVDPVAWVDKLPTELGKPSISTDGSSQDYDKVVNKIAKSAYTAVVTELNDMTKEGRSSLARELEDWVITNVDGFATYTDSGAYKYSTTARIELNEPNLTRVNGISANGSHQFAFSIPLASLGTGTAIDVGSKHLRVDVIFTDIAKAEINLANIENVMSVPTSSVQTSNRTITVSIADYDSIAHIAGTSAKGYIDDLEVSISVNAGTNNISIKPRITGNSLPTTWSSVTGIVGLNYVAGSSSNPIVTITKSGNDILFTPVNSTSVSPWKIGETPAAKEEASTPTEQQANGSGANNNNSSPGIN